MLAPDPALIPSGDPKESVGAIKPGEDLLRTDGFIRKREQFEKDEEKTE